MFKIIRFSNVSLYACCFILKLHHNIKHCQINIITKQINYSLTESLKTTIEQEGPTFSNSDISESSLFGS